jgi:glycosyltransferase involved in cell wall biosynthesis
MQKIPNKKPRIWFPAIKANTGADVFTQQLVQGLNKLGFTSEITWLPHYAEYLPWMVRAPITPSWADVVHVNSWLPVKFIPKDIPIVSTIHHSIYDPSVKVYKGFVRNAYHEWWIKKIEKRNMGCATQVVAVSRDAAQVVGAALGCQDIKVIYNGVCTSSCLYKNRKHPNKPFKLIYVGSWVSRKGVDLFAPIMSQLGNDFELVIVGGSPKVHKQKHYPKNISFLGRINDRSDLFNLLLSCDAFLFPSRSEGLSLGLIEAQLCGLPAICANYSSMPEVISSGVNGIICEQNNTDSFAAVIRKLSMDHLVWNDMRQAAHECAKSKFSLDEQILLYTELYKKLTVKNR